MNEKKSKPPRKKSPSFPIYSVINDFESLSHQQPRITCQMRSMFYALINICMARGGINEFSITYEYLKHASRIGSSGTYYKTLERLEEIGAIEYTKGANGQQMAIVKILTTEETTSKMKCYWDAITLNTRVPTILATLRAMEECKRNISKDRKDRIRCFDKKDTDTHSEVHSGAEEYSKEFEEFWALYDLNVNIKSAWEEWNKLHENDIKDIFENLPLYIKSKKEKRYRKHPARYLSEQVWKNEIITIKTEDDEHSRRISGTFSEYEEETL